MHPIPPQTVSASPADSPRVLDYHGAAPLVRTPLPIYFAVGLPSAIALGLAIAWVSILPAVVSGVALISSICAAWFSILRDRRHRAKLRTLRGMDARSQLNTMIQGSAEGPTYFELVRLLRQLVLDGHAGVILRFVDLGPAEPAPVSFEPIALQFAGARSAGISGDPGIPDEHAARSLHFRVRRALQMQGTGFLVVLLVLVSLGLLMAAISLPIGVALTAFIVAPILIGWLIQMLISLLRRRWWIANGVVFARARTWLDAARCYRRTDSILTVYHDYAAMSSRTCLTLVSAAAADEFFATPDEARFVINAFASPIAPPTNEMLEPWL